MNMGKQKWQGGWTGRDQAEAQSQTETPAEAQAEAKADAQVIAPTPGTLPTVSISASPDNMKPGDTSTITWSTTGATTADLSNVGPVEMNGTTTVKPTTSTNYTLKAVAADGAAQTGTVTVSVIGTPNAPPQPEPISAQSEHSTHTQLEILDDVAAVKGTLSSVAADARAEYEALSESAKGHIHQAINDAEMKFNVKLPAMHTLYGAEKPKVKK
jgi:hypothetical protein